MARTALCRGRASAAPPLRVPLLVLGLLGSAGLLSAKPEALPAAPEARGPESAGAARPPLDELDAVRQRWQEKSPEEQELLRQRFEEWREMGAEERQELLQRFERYQGFETRLSEAPPPGLREAIGGLDPERQSSRWREQIHEFFRRRGERMRGMLPATFVERLEQAPPEYRPEMIRQFRLQQIEEKGKLLLDYLARELGISPEEVRVIESRPLDEQVDLLRALRRKHLEKVARDGAPPPGFTRERWELLGSLSDREFFDRLLDCDVPAWRRRLEPTQR